MDNMNHQWNEPEVQKNRTGWCCHYTCCKCGAAKISRVARSYDGKRALAWTYLDPEGHKCSHLPDCCR